MFSNYFFVPASKERLIKKSEEIKGIDNRIFDFEDSVLSADIESSLKLLEHVEKRETDWIRIPLLEDVFDKILWTTIKMGYNNFIIPKFQSCEELDKYISEILSANENSKFILLIENPHVLVELEKILMKFEKYIHGVGLGSHDFSVKTGIKNDLEILRNIRLNILILAKAYNVEAIDVASMNISNESDFKEEIVDGFNCGYRSKFLLHPFQLQVLNSFAFYTRDEIENYAKILKYYKNDVEGQDALFSYEGKVYEKMHIKQLKKIVNWGRNFYGADR